MTDLGSLQLIIIRCMLSAILSRLKMPLMGAIQASVKKRASEQQYKYLAVMFPCRNGITGLPGVLYWSYKQILKAKVTS